MVCLAGYARQSPPSFVRIAVLFCFLLCFLTTAHLPTAAVAQASAPQAADAKKTPQDSNTPPDEQILASFEGQAVITVEIAGRPDLNTAQFGSNLVQKAGEPFAREKVQASCRVSQGNRSVQGRPRPGGA